MIRPTRFRHGPPLILALLFLACSLQVKAGSAPTNWTSTVSPTTAGVNEVTSFTFTVASTGSTVGRVQITVPSQFNNANLGNPTISGQSTGVNFTVSRIGTTITAEATTDPNRLESNGEFFSFTLQASGSPIGGPYTWTTQATERINGTGASGGPSGGSPGVTIDAVMPVELLYFKGYGEGENTRLVWSTATEINNEKFIVERSENSRTFIDIGEIRGHGTTSEQKSYQFVDEQPLAGNNYYRLKQMDFDGAYEYHDIIVVESEGRANPLGNLTITPNPVKNDLKFRWTKGNIDRPSDIQIFDISGRLVSTHTLRSSTDSFDLPVNHLDAGIYILRIFQDSLSESIRFMKD